MLDANDSSFDDAADEPAAPDDPGDAVERDWVDAEMVDWPNRPVVDDLDVARRLFAHLAGRIRRVGQVEGAIAPVG
jgi:hypothetical protein